jgi:hypothetical protein
MNAKSRRKPIRNTHTDRKCRAAIRASIAKRDYRAEIGA